MKQKHEWVVIYEYPADNLGWWLYKECPTRKLAREFKKVGKNTFPDFQWKIVKVAV